MSGINIIRRWVMSQMTKKADDGIMITLPEKNKVDLNVSITMDRLLRNGIDPNQITNPQQVDNAINMINSKLVNRAIPADSDEGRKITEKIFGKQKAPVFDLEGNRIPEGSGIMGGKSLKNLMDSGQVTKGARGMKKSKKVEDREMFQAANERLKSDVDTIIKNIKSMEPITAMKEANSVIARKGKYKNLTQEQSKKILQDTEDHIFERNLPEDPEDFAAGGIARAPFVGGGMGRREFLKLLGSLGAGIGAVKTGILGLGGKQAGKEVVKEVAQSAGSGTPPPYFFNLVNKIKKMGDDTLATQDKAIAKKYKDYVMEEDFAGNISIIRKGDMDAPGYEEVYMSYSVDDVPIKSKKGSTKVEEYEEYTARPDGDGKMKDVEDGVPDDVIEDAFEEAPSIKKASGGIARMLGE